MILQLYSCIRARRYTKFEDSMVFIEYHGTQETPPEAVCRVDRNTRKVLAKYRDSYLSRD